MRLRLVDQATFVRWAAFALWLGAASVLPLYAIDPSLWVVSALLMGAGVSGLSPLSPIPLVARIFRRRLGRRLERAGRVDLVGYRSRVHPLVALLVGGTVWTLPLFAGAYAMKNQGPVGIVVALLVLAATTAGVGSLLRGTAVEVLTLGVDGLHRAGHGFVPHGAVTGVDAEGGQLVVRYADGAYADGADLHVELRELADMDETADDELRARLRA